MRLGDDEKAYYTVESQAPLQQGEAQSTANVAGRPITGIAIEVGRHHGAPRPLLDSSEPPRTPTEIGRVR